MGNESKDPDPNSPGENGSNDTSGTPERDWVDETYPLVDADFVGDTLDRVLHDRCEIESEAELCDDIEFQDGIFDTYVVPPVRPGFLDDTLAKVLADRAEGHKHVDASDYEFERLVEAYQAPEPSPDFVTSTLEAVLAQQSKTQASASSPQSGPIHKFAPPARSLLGSRPYSAMAAAAALILCAVLFFSSNPNKPLEPAVSTTIAAPVAWASLITEAEPDQDHMTLLVPDRSTALDLFVSASTEGFPR